MSGRGSVAEARRRRKHFRRPAARGWKIQDFRGEGIVRLQAFNGAIRVAKLDRELLPAKGAG